MGNFDAKLLNVGGRQSRPHPAAIDCWGSCCDCKGCRGMNASASARGQADSGVAEPGGGGVTWRGATGTGDGEKRLLKAFEGAERSATGAGVAFFGSSRLFTRAINSCARNGFR